MFVILFEKKLNETNTMLSTQQEMISMNFLQGYTMGMGSTNNTLRASALGSYERDYAATHPEYRASEIAKRNTRLSTDIAEIKAACPNPQDAMICLAWFKSFRQFFADFKNINTKTKRQQDLLKATDLLLNNPKGMWSVDQAFVAIADLDKTKTSSKFLGSSAKDKTYFTKVFNASKGVFTQLKSKLGNPTAFWQDFSKAMNTLDYAITDDTSHPLYISAADERQTSGVKVLDYGIIAGAIAALGSVKATPSVVQFLTMSTEDRRKKMKEEAQRNKQAAKTPPTDQQTPPTEQTLPTDQETSGDTTEPDLVEEAKDAVSTGVIIGVSVSLLALAGAVGYLVYTKKKGQTQSNKKKV